MAGQGKENEKRKTKEMRKDFPEFPFPSTLKQQPKVEINNLIRCYISKEKHVRQAMPWANVLLPNQIAISNEGFQ